MQFGDEHKAWQKNRSLELKSKTSILRTYSYDPVGNRLTFNEDGEIDTSTLATDSNQLLAVSGVNAESRLYDIQGNSLQLSTPLFDDLQLTYNQSGRLKTLSNSGTVSDYLYDGNNLRVVKDNDGVVTHYHYDLQGRLLAETDSDGTLRRAVVWYGATPAALIDIEQSEPTFYTCTTTESFTDAAGPGMTIDTVAHSIVIQDGDYAGTYAISDEDWQVYPTAIVFSWRGGGVEFQGGLYPDYELPRRSGGLIFYEDDDEGNSQIADIYKVWKESESGGSAVAAPYQIHTDQIGAPVLLTDATGTAVWSAQYAPFGQATINSDVDGDGAEVVCNLRFPGQYFDAESGLHYNWHRYYEPRSGRYITLDPIGLYGGINLYAYVQGNPVNRIDVTGFAGCYVLFPNYPITYAPGLTSTWLGGHAGILGFDESGSTRYYEFGRYAPNGPGIIGVPLSAEHGNVRRVTIPDLVIGEDGNPTAKSWQQLQKALSRRAGHGTEIEMTCDMEADEDDIYKYASDIANDPNRTPYSWHPWSPTHCRSFAEEALEAGK
ncbi:RHS repeat-associated core domain-containing protein [Desulfuromonas acetoxidans]|uniref:RHS repeat-associated core domain-containing protein n=1 Tax=Desulfuromonas acetoxidans TaxID=891 RepID=UPI002930F8B2|nr:RHS repeat-associated core domain-containing protein [Desulfuromonas acetoxidans]